MYIRALVLILAPNICQNGANGFFKMPQMGKTFQPDLLVHFSLHSSPAVPPGLGFLAEDGNSVVSLLSNNLLFFLLSSVLFSNSMDLLFSSRCFSTLRATLRPNSSPPSTREDRISTSRCSKSSSGTGRGSNSLDIYKVT